MAKKPGLTSPPDNGIAERKRIVEERDAALRDAEVWKGRADGAIHDRATYLSRASALARELAEAKQKIDALKMMLRSAELREAEAGGYLRRVAEDDHARDGYFPDAEGTNRAPIARRSPPSYLYSAADLGREQGVARAMTASDRNGRSDHWSKW